MKCIPQTLNFPAKVGHNGHGSHLFSLVYYQFFILNMKFLWSYSRSLQILSLWLLPVSLLIDMQLHDLIIWYIPGPDYTRFNWESSLVVVMAVLCVNQAKSMKKVFQPLVIFFIHVYFIGSCGVFAGGRVEREMKPTIVQISKRAFPFGKCRPGFLLLVRVSWLKGGQGERRDWRKVHNLHMGYSSQDRDNEGERVYNTWWQDRITLYIKIDGSYYSFRNEMYDQFYLPTLMVQYAVYSWGLYVVGRGSHKRIFLLSSSLGPICTREIVNAYCILL